MVELGYYCSENSLGESTCAPKCGDGIKAGTELCDNGNQTGCSAGCVPDKYYECPTVDINGKSVCTPICGDAVRVSPEECDNGKKAGCTNCKIEAGYKCKEACIIPDHFDTLSSTCWTVCGDGIKAGLEECDNKLQEGCWDCTVQPGYSCTGTAPSVCQRLPPKCGNGVLEGTEACDDANLLKGDGCGSDCKVESGFRCYQPLIAFGPSICYRAFW